MKFRLLALCAFMFAANASAFKLDTHVWVGSQIIEDVATDGKVSIPPFGDFSVDADIVEALRTHPKSYLYGNVGPDFFPDVMAGQLIIHPGADVDEDGIDDSQWNTDDWFRHILATRDTMKPSELAFSMGFVAHGASDFWAHTYVNTYAGNIFTLTDGDQAEAEIRHYLLEGYVNKFTPDVVKANGQNVGRGIDVLNSYPGTFPNKFIRYQLMTSDEIQDQLTLAPHIKIASAFRDELPNWIELVDDNRDLVYKLLGDLWESMEPEVERQAGDNQELVEIICNTTTELLAGGNDAELMVAHAEEMDALKNDFETLSQDLANESYDAFEDNKQKMHEISKRYLDQGAEFAQGVYDNFSAVETRMLDNKHNIERDLLALDSKVRARACSLLEEVFISPAGIHEYALDNLPFGNALRSILDTVFDPLNIGIDPFNPLSFLDGDEPEPPPVITTTGDRAYFTGLLTQTQAELDANPDAIQLAAFVIANRPHYIEFVEEVYTEVYEAITSFKKMPDHHSVLSDEDLEDLKFYKIKKDLINTYSAALSSMGENDIVTTYVAGQGSGFSSDSSGSWFCDTVNGFVNDSLTRPLNEIQRLERDLLGAKNDLASAAETLNAAISEAIDIVHTFEYQIDKKFQTSINSIVDLTQSASNLAPATEAYADLIVEVKDKMQQLNKDFCADQRSFQAYMDEATIEGAPFVGSYFFNEVATAFGYCGISDDPLKEGVSGSFDAYTSGSSGDSCESDSMLYWEWAYFWLRNWKNGVDQALNAYPNTQRDVVDAVLDPSSDLDDYKEPIKQYMICEAPKFIGVSPHGAHILCIAQASAESLHKSLKKAQTQADEFVEKYALAGIPEKFKITKSRIDQMLTDALVSFTRKELSGNEAFELLSHVIEGGADDPYVVNSVFSTTTNEYLTFDFDSDPVTARVEAEMFVKNGKFDPLRFAPAYNAVILAKLALLNASELNRLVDISGGHSHIYGSELFDDSDGTPFNIMIDGVRTLDGDHQWLAEPPQYIRRDGSSTEVFGNTSYAYDGTKGFRLYQDEDARKNVFNKIFLGPANVSIEVPQAFGFDNIVPSEYAYKPCQAFPYPNGEGDNICLLSWLIPVLSLLN